MGNERHVATARKKERECIVVRQEGILSLFLFLSFFFVPSSLFFTSHISHHNVATQALEKAAFMQDSLVVRFRDVCSSGGM